MTRLISIITVLLCGLAFNVSAAEKDLEWEWKRPGTCRFDGTREDVTKIIKKFGLVKSVEEKFVADFLASTLPLSDVIQEMKQAGASAEALAAIEKQTGGRKFFTKGELQKLTGVPAAAMETLAKKVSDTAAKPFTIKKGYKFQKMFNCKGDVRERGIYNPDPGQPEQLEAIAFEYTEAGVTHRFVLPGVCDNFTYEKTEVGLTLTKQLSASSRKEIAKALAGGGPPEASHTFIYNVWSLSRSTPEGRKLLERLVSGAQGGQSRDLGNKILGAAAVGAVTRGDGSEIFKAEFFDIRLDRAKNERVWVSAVDKGRLVMVDLPLSRMVESVISQGEGWMTFAVKREEKDGVVTYTPPDWATDKIATEIHTPYRGLAYPASGSLKTCGPATAGRCGGDVQSPTALYRRISQPGVTNFHFVVR